jgi:hypothetical protein
MSTVRTSYLHTGAQWFWPFFLKHFYKWTFLFSLFQCRRSFDSKSAKRAKRNKANFCLKSAVWY